MNLILYAWGSNTDNILKDALSELGHEVSVYSRKCENYTKDMKLAKEIINRVHEFDAQAIVSYDYFPIISMICNTIGITYYSWVYDCPHYTLFAKTANYKCNRIGCFDRELADRLNKLSISSVFHLPLGVSWPEINNSEDEKYRCDVSFVGNLYTGAYDYFNNICINEGFKESAIECVNKQCFNYEHDYIRDFFRCDNNDKESSKLNEIREILSEQKLLLGDEYIEDIEYIFASSFLEKQVTIEERKLLLDEVARLGCNFHLYTSSELKDDKDLMNACKGYADYNKVMPKVFRNSCINLNITLRSIKSGIPLRALDIMGCGGFLLSNYQKELGEYFEENKEIVMFYNLEDCLGKINYYLTHEDERKAIAIAGYKAVRERFDCKKQLEKLLLS